MHLPLDACSAACVANSSGCACFDHITSPDDVGETDTGAAEAGERPRRRQLEEGGEAECRLHKSGADIVTNEVSHYTAYWKQP